MESQELLRKNSQNDNLNFIIVIKESFERKKI